MIFTYDRKPLREITTYKELNDLIDSISKKSLKFKSYDNVKPFFDEILSREFIGIKKFRIEWRKFSREFYPNYGDKCLNYYLVRGYTEDEANVLIAELQKEVSKKGDRPEVTKKRVESWKRNNSEIKTKRGRDFYRLKGLSEDEIEEKFQKRNEKWMNSLESYIEKTGDNFHERKGMTREQWIDRFGIEHTEKIWESRSPWKNVENLYGVSFSEYMEDKKFSKKNWIKKYGEEVAEEMMIDLNKRKPYTLKSANVSKMESLFGETLSEDWKSQIFFKESGKRYLYDFYNEKEKRIIEFQGEYWHCDPRKYSEDYFHTIKQMTAKEIWEYDAKKRKIAENLGWTVEYMWEHDFREILKTRIQSEHAINSN
jgi:hypothetical protein